MLVRCTRTCADVWKPMPHENSLYVLPVIHLSMDLSTLYTHMKHIHHIDMSPDGHKSRDTTNYRCASIKTRASMMWRNRRSGVAGRGPSVSTFGSLDSMPYRAYSVLVASKLPRDNVKREKCFAYR
jgi:hypothetical protein